GVEPALGADAAGDGECNREWEGDDADDGAGKQIPGKLLPGIVLQGCDKLGKEHAGEAPVGIERTNRGFADLCLTTWLRRRFLSAELNRRRNCDASYEDIRDDYRHRVDQHAVERPQTRGHALHPPQPHRTFHHIGHHKHRCREPANQVVTHPCPFSNFSMSCRPSFAASPIALVPSSFCSFGSAPCASRYVVMSAFPCRTASCKGAHPFSCFPFPRAPASTSNYTASNECPPPSARR